MRAFGFLLQYILTVNVHVTAEALGETLAALGPEVGELALFVGAQPHRRRALADR